MTMGRVSEIIGKTIGAGLIAIMFAGCASLARPVGQIAKPEESATIVGFWHYYVVHFSRGRIMRVDSSWLGVNSDLAVKVAPGQHLVQFEMTQYSMMNWPLWIGNTHCALILTAEPGKTYDVNPPSIGTYYRFWYNPDVLIFLPPKRIRSTITVDVSGGGDPEQSLDLPLDCKSERIYCRVASDCVGKPWEQPDAEQAGTGSTPPECIYDEYFPVGTCSSVMPWKSPDNAGFTD